jgi:hypothetical protein
VQEFLGLHSDKSDICRDIVTAVTERLMVAGSTPVKTWWRVYGTGGLGVERLAG